MNAGLVLNLNLNLNLNRLRSFSSLPALTRALTTRWHVLQHHARSFGVLETWYCGAIRFLRFSCRLSAANYLEHAEIFRKALAEGHIHRSLGQRERQRPAAQVCSRKTNPLAESHIQPLRRQKTGASPAAIIHVSTPVFQQPGLALLHVDAIRLVQLVNCRP